MSFYLDTSALVAAFTSEGSSERVDRWLRAHVDTDLAISPWAISEFSSALSLKVRMGSVPLGERALILANWAEFRSTLRMLPITDDDFLDAARLCEHHDLNLRAPDALHIAIARSAACELVTLDKTMANAAKHFGVTVATI